MADRKLRLWVEDQLFLVFGLSERHLVDFLIDMATSSSSPEHLLKSIVAAGLKSNEATLTFSQQLFRKFSASGGGRRHTLSSSLADLATDPLSSNPSSTSSTAPLPLQDVPQKTKKRNLRTQEAGGWDVDAEEDDVRRNALSSINQAHFGVARTQNSSDSSVDVEQTESQRLEMERMRDVQEREEFEQQLRDKDLQKTKKLVQERSAGRNGDREAEDEKRRNLADDPAARLEVLPDMRLRSRQHYMGKREKQKLEELRLKIQDEEFLFRTEELTEAEKQKHAYNKELLRLAEERLEINEDTLEQYTMPLDYIEEKGILKRKKEEAVLNQRYESDVKHSRSSRDRLHAPPTEQEQWEKQQISAALPKKSTADGAASVGDYDYVFDEEQHVDFILERTMPGELEEASLVERVDPKLLRKQSIQQVRDSLPIFAYRDELLSAIAEHQTLIVVGETGSGLGILFPHLFAHLQHFFIAIF